MQGTKNQSTKYIRSQHRQSGPKMMAKTDLCDRSASSSSRLLLEDHQNEKINTVWKPEGGPFSNERVVDFFLPQKLSHFSSKLFSLYTYLKLLRK